MAASAAGARSSFGAGKPVLARQRRGFPATLTACRCHTSGVLPTFDDRNAAFPEQRRALLASAMTLQRREASATDPPMPTHTTSGGRSSNVGKTPHHMARRAAGSAAGTWPSGTVPVIVVVGGGCAGRQGRSPAPGPRAASTDHSSPSRPDAQGPSTNNLSDSAPGIGVLPRRRRGKTDRLLLDRFSARLWPCGAGQAA